MGLASFLILAALSQHKNLVTNSELPTSTSNGAHLASATVPWHWLFFCPAPKVRAYFGCPVTKNLDSPKWHWLIFAPMGALVYTLILTKFISSIKLFIIQQIEHIMGNSNYTDNKKLKATN